MANGTCSRDECPKSVLAKGLCKKHYADARAERLSQEQCKADGCTNPRGGTGGYCPACYQRSRTYGDPNAGPPRRKRRGDPSSASSHGGPEHPASYYVNHRRVRAELGPAWEYECAHCSSRAMDWATIHERSGESPDDFMPLCKSCHNVYDGLSANFPHVEGESHPQAKLTEASVREIRTAAASGIRQNALARRYGVSESTVMNVVKRRNWKHVA